MEVEHQAQTLDPHAIRKCIDDTVVNLASVAYRAGGFNEPLQGKFGYRDSKTSFQASEVYPPMRDRLLYADVWNTLDGINVNMQQLGNRETRIGIFRARRTPQREVRIGKATIRKRYLPGEVDDDESVGMPGSTA